jgi:hypothetical protein
MHREERQTMDSFQQAMGVLFIIAALVMTPAIIATVHALLGKDVEKDHH